MQLAIHVRLLSKNSRHTWNRAILALGILAVIATFSLTAGAKSGSAASNPETSLAAHTQAASTSADPTSDSSSASADPASAQSTRPTDPTTTGSSANAAPATPANTPATVAAVRKAALGSPAPESVQSSKRAVSNNNNNSNSNSNSNSNNAPAATSGGYGCAAALAYLSSHAAPGFSFSCPGYAYGNQAMTCVNHAPQCPNSKIIAIAVPCAAAYMNEASNSWVLTGARSGAIDPYGHC